MPDDPFAGYGLRSVQLADQATFRPYFNSLREPLSDYTFSQIYTWRNSLHLVWKILHGHLCVFANGTGDLTLLMPPIGDGNGDAAMREAFELMDDYNTARGVADRSGVEYASEELLARVDRSRFDVSPMGADYVYDTARMIDLAGGDLSSKRQAKNRFLRLYEHHVEPYDRARHLDDCVALLQGWRTHQDAHHPDESNTSAIKRQKETIATELALRSAGDLGLKGMVVYVADGPAAGSESRDQGLEQNARLASCSLAPDPRPLRSTLRGFTFGEHLGPDQSSIVIEKTNLEIKGLAQFIFSEFCRREWADRPLCNVGDDWGLESLAWTKQSYRPVKMLQKFALKKIASSTSVSNGIERAPLASAVLSRSGRPERARLLPLEQRHVSLRPLRRDRCATGERISAEQVEPAIRLATKSDLPFALELECVCFASDISLKNRQLEYLQQRASAIFIVAEQDGHVIGDGIALVRRQRQGLTGRIYSLAVHPQQRGKKFGQRLLHALMAGLVARGVKRIYLEVDHTNAAAVALYERNGFRTVNILSGYYGEGRDAMRMLCDLADSSTHRALANAA